jgi:DNA-binding transcriptional ArsR family regulator
MPNFLSKELFAYKSLESYLCIMTDDASAANAPEGAAAQVPVAQSSDVSADPPLVRAAGPVTRLTDPRALRAMAHPIRLSLIGALRQEGPLTATQAGEIIGESSASCSFHLRQLARWGLVEEAGGGKGRERPWRATTNATSWPEIPDSPAAAAASTLLSTVLAERYFELLRRWLNSKPDEPEDWQRAAHFGDTGIFVTADELLDLQEKVMAVLEPYRDRQDDPASRPPDSRRVAFLHLAFPANFALPTEGKITEGKITEGKTAEGKTAERKGADQ